jgi:galactose oxidase
MIGMLTPSQDPYKFGAWSVTVGLPVIPIASALLPNGNIIAWSSNEPNTFESDIGHAPSRTLATLFNPITGQVSPLLDTGLAADMFCPGLAYLPDGRIMVNGGSSSYHTAIYDPFLGTFGTWYDAADMNIARGYNSSVTLSNGNVFTIGGSWSGSQLKNGELWVPGRGWTDTGIAPLVADDPIDQAVGYTFYGDNHPWLFAMPNGRVFDAGPPANMAWFDPLTGASTPAGNRGDDAYSMNGIAVMYAPGKILKAGGAPTYTTTSVYTDNAEPGIYDASNSAYVIDVSANYTNPNAAPAVTKIAPLNHERTYANGVVLPNGDVFVVGGQAQPELFTDSDSVMTPELFHPATMTFTNLAAMPVPRNYHSTALLLPDGSVYVGGGGACGGCPGLFSEAGSTSHSHTDDSSADHPDYNIYKPSYLFNIDGSAAIRPTIVAAPNALVLGNRFQVTVSGNVANFSLVRLGATTHAVDTDQRRIPLAINAVTADRRTFDLGAPGDPGITVPGYYMLFALDAKNTPSMAKIIHVETPAMALSGVSPALADFPIASLAAGEQAAMRIGQGGLAGALGADLGGATIPFFDHLHETVGGFSGPA